MSTLKVTQLRSRNGSDKSQLATLRSLGLRRIDQTVEREDNPQLRGMVHRIRHLVDIEGDKAGGAGRSRAAGGRESSSKARAGGPQGDS